MAISMKNWKDRITQYPNRRKLINVSTGEETIVDVVRAEGNVTEAGDTFTAAVMNDLEDRIDNAFDNIAASDVAYDNTVTGSSATDTQSALDEALLVKSGLAEYSGLKGGGFDDRITVHVTFDNPMPDTNYAIFAGLSDYWADFDSICCYPSGGSRTTTGFDIRLINKSGNATAVSGQFYWITVPIKS